MIKRRENVYFLRARAFRTTHTNLGLQFVLRYELWNVVQNIEKLGSVTRTLIFLIVQLRHKHIGFFAFFSCAKYRLLFKTWRIDRFHKSFRAPFSHLSHDIFSRSPTNEMPSMTRPRVGTPIHDSYEWDLTNYLIKQVMQYYQGLYKAKFTRR